MDNAGMNFRAMHRGHEIDMTTFAEIGFDMLQHNHLNHISFAMRLQRLS